MPIYAPTGFLDVTNATLRGSKIVTTSNVGVANLNPLNTLSVGSNLQVEDTGSNVLTVRGNAAAAAMTLGVITLAPSYSLEIVSNIGNTVSNTVQFTNDTTGFVSTSNIEIGTNNLFVDTTTGTVTVGKKLDVTDAHLSNLTVDGALYANAATGSVGVNTTNPGNFAIDVHGSANVGALTATEVTVTGNLAVTGEITAIRSTTVNVDDPIIGLANNNTSDPAVLDIGFVMARPSTATGSNVAIIFDESADTLEIGYTAGKHTDTTITMDDSSLFHTNIHGNVSVSNLNIGQFSVVPSYGLDHVTNENNSTGDTLISTNATTGLQTTANVSVGRDALVSGNVEVSQDLTVTGDLAVDTDTLFVDATSGRVGVGTVSPSVDLDVAGEMKVSGNVEVGGELTVASNVEVGTANLFVDTTTGRVGMGTTQPTEHLEVNGNVAIQGSMTYYTDPFKVGRSVLNTLSPTVWAVAGESTARVGGGAISYSTNVTIEYLNGTPMWYIRGRDENVDIFNTISDTTNTWTVAIAIAKKPQCSGYLFVQLPPGDTTNATNHAIFYGGTINGDEYDPGGNGWNINNPVSIPDESVIVVRKNGTGSNGVTVWLNGGIQGTSTSPETYSGSTPDRIRLGQRGRYPGYSDQTPIYTGFAAVAAWDTALSDTQVADYIHYNSLTAY